MTMDSTTAGVTSSVELAVTNPDVAVMTVEPTVNDVASPEWVSTEATDAVPEDQLALEVTSEVLPSVKVPLAENCCVSPLAMLGLVGVMVIEASVTGGGAELAVPRNTVPGGQ